MIKVTIIIFTASALISYSEQFGYVHCCEYPDVISKEVQDKCPLNVTSNNEKDLFLAEICHANCLAKQLDMVKGDLIDTDKFNAAVEKIAAGNSEAKDFYIRTMAKCEKDVLNMEKVSKFPKMECSFKTFGELSCLGNSLVMKCPEARVIKSPACEAQQKFFNELMQKINGK